MTDSQIRDSIRHYFTISFSNSKRAKQPPILRPVKIIWRTIKNIKILISLMMEITFLSPNKKREINEPIKILKFCKYSPTQSKFP